MYCNCLFYTIITIYVSYIECRVYCQDKNAHSWVPFGYSCPVTCNSIISAIGELKQMDYERTIHEGIEQKLLAEMRLDSEHDLNIVILRRNGKTLIKLEKTIKAKTNKDIQTSNEERFNSNENIIHNNENYNVVSINLNKNKVGTNVKVSNSPEKYEVTTLNIQNLPSKCWNIYKYDTKAHILKLRRVICAKKSNFDHRLLLIMTNILNQYIKSVFKFTAEITEILLEKLFLKNTELRNNILHVHKLLKYLREAISQHNLQNYDDTIELKSQHCLLTAIPGCFCKPGFVESLGQCVRPSECVSKKKNLRYLQRIVVN